jgi:molybdate/tungstate transport system substrate-binding protein
MKMLIRKIFLFALIIGLASCTNTKNQDLANDDDLSGKLIIFHAGSLSVPFMQIADTFQKLHPKLEIQREVAGSVACARKITELKKPCDILASADYGIINKMLVPDYASWCIRFAANEMVIAYNQKSLFHNEINTQNCFETLLKKEVKYGRSDPNSDPCGYRSVMVTNLAQSFYKIPDLQKKLMAKDQEYIRPKETDLLALLQTNTIDYMFIYRSVAEQHHLNFVILPDSVNLKNAELNNYYQNAEVKIRGNTPKEWITQKGQAMVYGISQMRNAPNKKAALAFLDFLLSKNKGMKIMEQNGQASVVPSVSITFDQIPEQLKEFAKQ